MDKLMAIEYRHFFLVPENESEASFSSDGIMFGSRISILEIYRAQMISQIHGKFANRSHIHEYVHTYIAHTTFACRFSNDIHHISSLFIIHQIYMYSLISLMLTSMSVSCQIGVRDLDHIGFLILVKQLVWDTWLTLTWFTLYESFFVVLQYSKDVF